MYNSYIYKIYVTHPLTPCIWAYFFFLLTQTFWVHFPIIDRMAL